jgi:hypothetical protein
MALLFSFFTVVLSLCVVGLIVLALSSILGSVRDDWKLKKPKREPRRRALSLVNSLAMFAAIRRASSLVRFDFKLCDIARKPLLLVGKTVVGLSET